jgi:hypothetical protein
MPVQIGAKAHSFSDPTAFCQTVTAALRCFCDLSRLLSPPHSLDCREIRLPCSENRAKSPQFLNFCSQTGPEKVSRFTPLASFHALFSGGQTRSPVSTTPSGECNAITNR